jgi:predicted tellurium resistance membrane protein TerC
MPAGTPVGTGRPARSAFNPDACHRRARSNERRARAVRRHAASRCETSTMESLTNPEIWIALGTLTALELVLGIDNIIFISILAGKLPPEQRDKARRLGIALAAITRLALLFAIAWIVGLTAPIFSVFSHEISWRDLILIGGGLFLIGKATHEIHQKLEGASEHVEAGKAVASFGSVIAQIMLLDVVFSLDSIITAVGMVEQRWVMFAAILISIAFMLLFARPIGDFVERHPTVKVLALSFLIMIGLVLMADGFGQKIPKGYIYAAMAFSVFVEMVNLWIRNRAQKKVAPVKLHERYETGPE